MGTITWYKVNHVFPMGSHIPLTKYTVTNRYSGKMVHGKLEGPVETVAPNGDTLHAAFAKGKRKDNWASGSVPSSQGPAKEPVRQNAAVVEAPAEGPPPATAQAPVPAPSPMAQQQPKQSVAENANRDTATQGNDLLQTLAAPPSSLRVGAAGEPSPEPVGDSSSSASSPSRLTQTEVIDLADAQARAQGYNLDNYQRPKAEYAPATDSWSVVYDQKSGDGSSETGKHFSVSIEDKTKKASIPAAP